MKRNSVHLKMMCVVALLAITMAMASPQKGHAEIMLPTFSSSADWEVECLDAYRQLYALSDRVFVYDTPQLTYEFDRSSPDLEILLSRFPWEVLPITMQSRRDMAIELGVEAETIRAAICDFTSEAQPAAHFCQFFFFAAGQEVETAQTIRIGLTALFDGVCIYNSS